MKEVTFRIPEESVDVITELVQQLGGKAVSAKKKIAPKKIISPKKKKEEVDHTFLFGKWKDYDIDAGKLRKDLWRRP
jgi:DNA-binding ferritin-like protein